ncbi:MAG: baseplate J/gp47 family protein [Desulfitobacteriaceae bacterium]
MQNTANWPSGVPKVTDFTPGSVTYTLLAAIAVGIDTNAYAIYLARQAAYIKTALGTDLDNKAADYGIIRKAAVAANGAFSFTKLTVSAGSITIPAGSLITTVPDATGLVVSFTTDAVATLPPGQTSVNVNVTCQTAGTMGNLAANTTLLIGSAIPGIDGVKITTGLTNGVAVESDDLLRTRALAAFASLARGTLAWYQQTALAVTGIQSATVAPQNRGAGTVDVFIVGTGNTIPSAALQASVQVALDAGRPVTDDAKEQTPTAAPINASVHLVAPGMDATVVTTAAQTAIQNYINNLGVGAGKIGWVYTAQIINAALGINGVVNATTTFADLQVSIYQLPQAGTITVTAN